MGIIKLTADGRMTMKRKVLLGISSCPVLPTTLAGLPGALCVSMGRTS